jgi:trimeric autotransporter adhesin
VSAEVLGKDGGWHEINLMIMHAKADADYDACTRRIYACNELKDSLDQYWVNKPFLLLGDYNDDLDISICSSYNTSNYSILVNDSADYKALTLPISRAGAFSIDGYSSLIDHVIASNSMYRYYLPNSAQSLRTKVKNMVTYYNSDVSDHFPILTRYVIDSTVATGVNEIQAPPAFAVFPNPANSEINLDNTTGQYQQYMLQSIDGRVLSQGSIIAGRNTISVARFPQGIYLLRLSGKNILPSVSKITVSH